MSNAQARLLDKKTRGRQRIPISLIQNKDDLYASFSKRRVTIYKKASELSTLCGVDIGIIMFSPTNKPFSFFHPSMKSVVSRYINSNLQLSNFARIVEAQSRAKIEHLTRRLDEVKEINEELEKRENYLDEIDKSREKGWWEEFPIDRLDNEEVKKWNDWFERFRTQITTHIEELKNGASSSSISIQHQNMIGPGTFAQNYVGQLPNQYFAQNPYVAGAMADQFSMGFNDFPPKP